MHPGSTQIGAGEGGWRAAVVKGLRELREAKAAKFLRDLSRALLWQLLGKLLQVVGFAYACRCLGPANVGLSGTVLVTAMFVQLVLDFGLDIISVRHVAGKTIALADITPAILSLRFLTALVVAALWLVVLACAPMDGTTRFVWALGAAHLLFLNLNFNWFYQATENMPTFSMIQNLISVAGSVYFLGFFHSGQAAGSDLLVIMILNAVGTVATWCWLHQRRGLRLFAWRSLVLAGRLFKEGRPTWAFNLCYYALSTMGLPLCNYLLGEQGNRESGYFRSAMLVVGALQVFLSYFALMLNPRIVAWRQTEPHRFRHRIFLLVAGLCLASVAVFAGLWFLRRPIFLLLFGRDFLPGAAVLPVLVAAKFLAVASGITVWGLFAYHRDWLAVRCVAVPTVALFLLHWWLVPRFGILAAAGLNFLGEFVLLIFCFLAFSRVEGRSQPAT
jgi:O-antigen/teichoic acid export membrane protein